VPATAQTRPAPSLPGEQSLPRRRSGRDGNGRAADAHHWRRHSPRARPHLAVLTSLRGAIGTGGAAHPARSELLPSLRGGIAEARRYETWRCSGFPWATSFPPSWARSIRSNARLYASQSIFDLSALNETRAEGHSFEAARLSSRSTREVVVLVTANLYLQALASNATRRLGSRAARDGAGTPGAGDRSQAERHHRRHRRRPVRGAAEHRAPACHGGGERVSEGKACSWPAWSAFRWGQPFTLSTTVPELPAPDMTVEQAVERAYRHAPRLSRGAGRLAQPSRGARRSSPTSCRRCASPPITARSA